MSFRVRGWENFDAIYWLAKDPFTAVGVAWLLTTGHSFLEAISLRAKSLRTSGQILKYGFPILDLFNNHDARAVFTIFSGLNTHLKFSGNW